MSDHPRKLPPVGFIPPVLAPARVSKSGPQLAILRHLQQVGAAVVKHYAPHRRATWILPCGYTVKRKRKKKGALVQLVTKLES